MSKKKRTYSVIINSPDYDLGLYKTVRNITLLEGHPYLKEVIILVDKKIMKDLLLKLPTLKGIDLHFSDIRNFSADNCKGENLLFLDSGDYISLNLLERFEEIEKEDNRLYVPEEKVFYGEQSYTHTSLSSQNELFTNISILTANIWGSSFLVTKKDYIRIQKSGKYFMGIKSFYCDVLSVGMVVDVIPQTLSFIHVRQDFDKKHLVASKEIFNKRSVKIKSSDIKEWEKSSIILPFFLSKRTKRIRSALTKIKEKEDDRMILKKIASELFPKLYLKLFALKEKRKKSENVYSEWMLSEWRKINVIEPKLYPPSTPLYRESQTPLNQNVDNYLYDILSHFPKELDVLILCPWLKRGGADKLVINLIKGLKQEFPDRKIGLITTEGTSSEILSEVDKDIYFFDYGNSFVALNSVEKQILLKRFLIEVNADKVVNVNSHSLFDLLLSDSKELSKYSDYYCFCFSTSRTKEGQLTGFAFDFIPYIVNDLKSVITDNHNIIKVLSEMFGLDPDSFSVLYQPVHSIDIEDKDYTKKESWDVLWASRIDYEKLPGVLQNLLKKVEGLNMNFHIYGSSVMDKSFNLRKLEKYKNVRTYGAYKGGLHGIHGEKYDLFLYTSWFDGMPNTLLEAISLGLPVVASNVGGISEIIKDGETGLLVDNIFNEDEYLEKLIQYTRMDNNNLNQVRKNAMCRLHAEHSWEKYRKTLHNIFK